MVKVITLGCRLNAYESEILKEKLAEHEDLIVINTCAVTAEAERQWRQTIRKIRRENPHARIVVTGCAAQIAAQKFADMPEADLILGNKEKNEILKYILWYATNLDVKAFPNEQSIDFISQINDFKEY